MRPVAGCTTISHAMGALRPDSLRGLARGERHFRQHRRCCRAAMAAQANRQSNRSDGGGDEKRRRRAEQLRRAGPLRRRSHGLRQAELLREEHRVRVTPLVALMDVSLVGALLLLILRLLSLALLNFRGQFHGAQRARIALFQDELVRGVAREFQLRHCPRDARRASCVDIVERAEGIATFRVFCGGGGRRRRRCGRRRRGGRRRPRLCSGRWATALPILATPSFPVRRPRRLPHIVLHIAIVPRHRLHLH
mmetsp:Transcript_66126/g.191564  ORF Transcript_66126/g.191564 Transcript_66126/m.191564 type:complete len:251 (+) Transcript_66126:304-1056(+)